MKALTGDALLELKKLPESFFHSLVTDPPAGISFMGKEWDDDKGGRDHWIEWMTSVMSECLRVLKPGAHGLVWALPRTSHWTATALEDAGFEVRDVVTHLFGTGFPKSMDISKAIDKAAGAEREILAKGAQRAIGGKGATSTNHGRGGIQYGEVNITAPSTEAAKQWAGWGTALKPASEHWILVRKPCSEKTVAANVLKWGVGGINIDASRVPGKLVGDPNRFAKTNGGEFVAKFNNAPVVRSEGRFPANLVLSHHPECGPSNPKAWEGISNPPEWICNPHECPISLLDQSTADLAGRGSTLKKTTNDNSLFGLKERPIQKHENNGGGASRFFYVAKASKSDKGAENTHPTVKSTALMTYLIKLVTPPGGVVLDPFMGSGSTGVAAAKAGFAFYGIEMNPEYSAIAKTRIDSAAKTARTQMEMEIK